MIPIGSLCYLVGSSDFAALNGRTVEVVGHEIAQDGTAWHVLDAEWLPEVFGERAVTAQAANLRPFAGPTKRDADAKRDRPQLETKLKHGR